MNSKFLCRLLPSLALLSVPLTVWALTDTTISISSWGSIGSNYSTSGTGGVLMVGNYGSNAGLYYGTISGYACVGASSSISSSTTVGRYNVVVSDPLFVVGCGWSGTTRNALEIYSDGRVKVPNRQADVLMGGFGN